MSEQEKGGVAVDEAAPELDDQAEEERGKAPAKPENKPEEKAEAKDDDGAERADPASRAGGAAEGLKDLSGVSNTNRFLHAAGAPFRVAGDFIGRDQYIVNVATDEPIRTQAVSKTRLDEIEHGYEEPDGFARLLDRVLPKRTVVLLGPAGQGKRATALRLLTRLQVTSIHVIDNAADLAELADRLEPDAAYVLFDPVRPDRLRGVVLQSLDAALERFHGRLFITVDADGPISDEDLRDYLVEPCPPPVALRVLHRQLDWRLGPSVRARLLALPEVRALVDELLADQGDSGPRVARDLAVLLSEEIGEDGVIDLERVHARLTRHRADDLDMWFRGLRDLPTRCHAIALAVLNGLPTEYVAEASARLRAIIESELPALMLTEGVLVPRVVDPFGTSRQTRLRRLRAHAREGEFRGTSGWTPVEVEEYLDPSYVPAVLERAFRQYEIQSQLLEWMSGLVRHASQTVRIQSAFSLGMFAACGFEQVQLRLLMPWAGSDDLRLRQAAAIALRYPASLPKLRNTVRRLIRRWYGSKSQPALQSTAALSYGYSYGIQQPDVAMDALDRLAAMDKWQVALGVGEALANLLLEHDTAIATDIFLALLRWLDDREKMPTAEIAFLVMANYLAVEDDLEAVRPRLDFWPGLLDLADREPSLRGALALLWQRVLSSSRFSRVAMDTLENWAGDAEFDPRGARALASLALAASEGQERTRLLFLRATDQWTEHTNLKPKWKAAAAVRSVLGGPEGAW
jgi:hypothetical protein